MIKLTNILREITVNKPSNIVNFLNRHKQEVWNEVVQFEIDDPTAEEFNLPENLKFTESTATDSNDIEYKVAVIDNIEIGLDFSFDRKAVSEENSVYIDTHEIKIAGRTVYYCSYSI
jgi:hypothetical protein